MKAEMIIREQERILDDRIVDDVLVTNERRHQRHVDGKHPRPRRLPPHEQGSGVEVHLRL